MGGTRGRDGCAVDTLGVAVALISCLARQILDGDLSLSGARPKG